MKFGTKLQKIFNINKLNFKIMKPILVIPFFTLFTPTKSIRLFGSLKFANFCWNIWRKLIKESNWFNTGNLVIYIKSK